MITSNLSKSPSTWIYEYYGTSIESVLLELGLDSSSILMDMNEKIIPIEEDICMNIFENTCKQKNFDYLEGYYNEIIKKIDFYKSEQEVSDGVVKMIYSIASKENLLKEESDI